MKGARGDGIYFRIISLVLYTQLKAANGVIALLSTSVK
jgi:hypothetical protein